MFLVTTANQSFWKTDEKILFLGEWCKLYKYKYAWSELDCEVHPYHWDDRERFRKDYIYLNNLYERYLPLLSQLMNQIHGVDHSCRYWRMIVGPWFYYFIGIFFDRYLSIESVGNKGEVTNVWLPPFEPEKYIPKNFSTFRDWNFGDDYNHYLFKQIIEALGKIPSEIKTKHLSSYPQREFFKRKPSSSGRGKDLVRKILVATGRLIPSKFNKVVFVNSFLNSKDLIRLQWELGQLPFPCTPIVISEHKPINWELRKRIVFSGEENAFEKLLLNKISQNIPSIYVEGYLEMSQKSLAAYPKHPQVIFTAAALFGNEGCTFWAANEIERGAKLVISQHGGHYGNSLLSANESHEVSVCDLHFSWGWDDTNQPKTLAMPSGQLAGLMPKIKPNPSGKILWLGFTFPRYTCQLLSAPLSGQTVKFFKEQERFLNAVLPEVLEILVRREFPIDFGWNEELRWGDINPDLKVYCGSKTMYEQLNQSRLCVGTCTSTPDLETLSRNFPTITFFNPKLFELRKSAKPYFDDLRRAGIYHPTPESAAAKVNEVYKDPLSWWNSREVQDARERFVYRFARTSATWISEWKEVLSSI